MRQHRRRLAACRRTRGCRQRQRQRQWQQLWRGMPMGMPSSRRHIHAKANSQAAETGSRQRAPIRKHAEAAAHSAAAGAPARAIQKAQREATGQSAEPLCMRMALENLASAEHGAPKTCMPIGSRWHPRQQHSCCCSAPAPRGEAAAATPHQPAIPQKDMGGAASKSSLHSTSCTRIRASTGATAPSAMSA